MFQITYRLVAVGPYLSASDEFKDSSSKPRIHSEVFSPGMPGRLGNDHYEYKPLTKPIFTIACSLKGRVHTLLASQLGEHEAFTLVDLEPPCPITNIEQISRYLLRCG